MSRTPSLEIDPRGGEMSIDEKGGGGGGRRSKALCTCTYTLGGSGGMLPQKMLDFRLSETASGAISGTLYIVNREFFIWKHL